MSERKTLQESLDELGRTSEELKALVLAEVAAHFWGLLAFVLLVVAALVIVGIGWPGVLE